MSALTDRVASLELAVASLAGRVYATRVDLYSEDQPRDDHGRFGGGGGSPALDRVTAAERAHGNVPVRELRNGTHYTETARQNAYTAARVAGHSWAQIEEAASRGGTHSIPDYKKRYSDGEAGR